MTPAKNKLSFLFPVEEMRATWARFPLAIICCVTLFIISVLIVHEVIADFDDEDIFKAVFVLSMGVFWFGFARLVQESNGWDDKKYALLALPVFAGLSLWVAYSEDLTNPFFVAFALPFLVMGAPYLRRGRDDDLSFWTFNRWVWIGALVAFFASCLWVWGFNTALIAIQFLFEIDINHKIYIDLPLFFSLVFAPVYVLSRVPGDFDLLPEKSDSPAAQDFFVNWVLAPLTLVYLAILYAYFVKILFMQELPRGQLSYMVTGFAGLGVITYLAGWPLRESGSPILRFFYRIFFPALIIPVGVQALSIWERVSQYGFTEQRYIIAATALWLGFLAVIFTFGRVRNNFPPLKIIPLSLAVLLILSSFGPWSALNVSLASQTDRLKDYMDQYNTARNGQTEQSREELSFENRQNISSAVDYIGSRHNQERLLEYVDQRTLAANMPGNEDRANDCREKWTNTCTVAFMKAIGSEYASPWASRQEENKFNIYMPRPVTAVRVTGYDFIYHGNIASGARRRVNRHIQFPNNEIHALYMWLEGDVLSLTGHGDPLVFNLQDIVRGAPQNMEISEPYILEAQNGVLQAKLSITNLSGRIESGEAVLNYIEYDLYLKML